MFVKCGGMRDSSTSGLLMSHFSRTHGSKIVTGFGISTAISLECRGLANVYISMNCKKSPGYSRRIRPSSARAIRFTCTYSPLRPIEPLMSMITTVAHFGELRVRWISMSSLFSRSGRSPPVRIRALVNVVDDVHVRDRVAELVRLRRPAARPPLRRRSVLGADRCARPATG